MTLSLQQIEELLSKITQGEWSIDQGKIRGGSSPHTNGKLRNSLGISSASFSDVVCEFTHDLHLDAPKANAELIAAAPSIVRQLIKEIAAWREVAVEQSFAHSENCEPDEKIGNRMDRLVANRLAGDQK